MEIGTLAADHRLVEGRGVGLRISSVIAALALVFTMFVLIQHRADAAPAAAGAAVAASVVSVGGGTAAQIDFRSIFCSILISIRNAFAGSPFFAFIIPILNRLVVAFGCAPS